MIGKPTLGLGGGLVKYIEKPFGKAVIWGGIEIANMTSCFLQTI